MTNAGMWRLTGVAAVATAILLAGAACGSQQDSPETSAPGRQADAGAGNSGAGQPGPEQPGGKPPGDPQQLPVGQPGRSIIYTGALSLRTDEVSAQARRAGELARGNDGFVGGDNRSLDKDGKPVAEVTLRVPSARFYDTVEALAALGTEERREIKTDDVTETVVDLDVRIANQRASVERVRALLARAQALSEIVSLEKELAQREAELASLEARRRTLGDRVSLSTITLRLATPVPVAPKREPKKARWGFLVGLGNGWSAFLAAGSVALTVLGFVVPFAAPVLVAALAAWWYVTRRRRRPAPTSP